MGWAELFTPEFEADPALSRLKLIADTNKMDVGTQFASDLVMDMCDVMCKHALWGCPVLGIKVSYDDVMHVVVYISQGTTEQSHHLETIASITSMWGTRSFRVGFTSDVNSDIIRYL